MVVEISSTAYSKVVLHAIKYPHCTVRGVLLGRKGSGGDSDVRILDVIPALHNALLAPPVEMLFIHLDAYCQESKLDILGVYFGKDRLNDERYACFGKRTALFVFEEILETSLASTTLGAASQLTSCRRLSIRQSSCRFILL